jgi:MYXO-CTERM domain-containing protein
MGCENRTLAVLLSVLVVGCGGPGEPESQGPAGEAEAVCPADAPDCDGLDEPCVLEEASAEEPSAPGASPLGLADPKNGAGNFRVWPDGRVPYKIASTVGSTTKTRLLAAMEEWRKKSADRVRFVKATSGDAAYLQVTEGSPQVSPHVGYRAGKVSTMQLRNPEYQTVIRHELGHVLGFHHEHKRSDRAGHIQVLSANIVNNTKCQYQFSKCTDCELVNGYHVKSVMHYRTYRDLASCRVNGNAVLLNKDGSKIDHEWVITSADLSALAVLYPLSGSGGAPPDGGLEGSAGSGTIDEDAGDDGGLDAWDAGAGGAAGDAGGAGWAGSWSTGGTAGVTGGEGGSAPAQQTRLQPVDSGCACRTTQSNHSRGAWLLVVALAAGVGRRARRGGHPESRP